MGRRNSLTKMTSMAPRILAMLNANVRTLSTNKTTLIVVAFFTAMCFVFWHMMVMDITPYLPEPGACDRVAPSYKAFLRRQADANGVVVLSLVDDGYVDMARNFHQVSLKPNGIANFGFISPLSAACQELQSYNLPCFAYTNSRSPVIEANINSKYGTKPFNDLMTFRSYALLDAMVCNFTVLMTDLDIVYFHSPLLQFTCTSCDMEGVGDGVEDIINAGLLFLRPRPATYACYTRMLAICARHSIDDQMGLTRALKELRTYVKFKQHPMTVFQSGLDYFEKGVRHFGHRSSWCENCITAHNNYVVGKEAKIYRFKENLMWYVDRDQYYSDKLGRYMTYSNPVRFTDPQHGRQMEENAFTRALAIAHILNRTLILPEFHCQDVMCSLMSVYQISVFEREFAGAYRENTFLRNPLVPDSVKASVSPPIRLLSQDCCGFGELVYDSDITCSGDSALDIISCGLTHANYAVLNFKYMYSNRAVTDTPGLSHPKLMAKLGKAFRYADYRQLL